MGKALSEKQPRDVYKEIKKIFCGVSF